MDRMYEKLQLSQAENKELAQKLDTTDKDFKLSEAKHEELIQKLKTTEKRFQVKRSQKIRADFEDGDNGQSDRVPRTLRTK